MCSDLDTSYSTRVSCGSGAGFQLSGPCASGLGSEWEDATDFLCELCELCEHGVDYLGMRKGQMDMNFGLRWSDNGGIADHGTAFHQVELKTSGSV